MTISHADPVQDADRYLTQVDSFAEATEAAERYMTGEMLAVMMRGDANAVASFAPTITDYTHITDDGKYIKLRRTPRLWEVMHESLDYGPRPNLRDLMALLLKVAHSDESQKQAAKDLLYAMAASFATYNAEAE